MPAQCFQLFEIGIDFPLLVELIIIGPAEKVKFDGYLMNICRNLRRLVQISCINDRNIPYSQNILASGFLAYSL